jgi:regulator of cell morphogenesis and NO signaling
VGKAYDTIREVLRLHMRKEERVLFPYIARMEAVAASAEALAASPFGSIRDPIGALEAEHADVGRALAAIRKHTAGYRAPEGACNTFRGLYHGLAELERDLHEHIQVEDNILFPRAAQMEEELLKGVRR